MTEDIAPYRIRKNIDIDAHKLAEARRLLAARTDTETVDMALDHVLMIGSEFAALDRLAALGGLEDPFAARPRGRRVAER